MGLSKEHLKSQSEDVLENNSTKESVGNRSHPIEWCISNLAVYKPRIIVVEIVLDCDLLTLVSVPMPFPAIAAAFL